MNPFIALFISREGRISRSRWWFGAVSLIVILLAIALILMALGFRTEFSYSGSVTAEGQGTSQFQGMRYNLDLWPNVVLTVLGNVAFVMLGIKRRHDRDNSGLDVVVFAVINIVLSLAMALGINGPVQFVLQVATTLGGLYLLIVLGFLRGTNGSNSYGPDPLGGGA